MNTGFIADGRYFTEPIVQTFNFADVLRFSEIITTLGIYSMSMATGNMDYISSLLCVIGVTYFWPTMID